MPGGSERDRPAKASGLFRLEFRQTRDNRGGSPETPRTFSNDHPSMASSISSGDSFMVFGNADSRSSLLTG